MDYIAASLVVVVILGVFSWALCIIAGDSDKSLVKDYHFEKIICPECGFVQKATVVHSGYGWDRVHKCSNCDYWILESEWQLAPGLPLSKRKGASRLK